MPAPQFHTLVIQLDGTGDIATFAVKPAEGIRETAEHKLMLSLSRLRHPLVNHLERLRVVPSTPAGETKKGETEQFRVPIVNIPGNGCPLPTEGNRLRKVPLPLRIQPQP
jgi:hypothetical protein